VGQNAHAIYFVVSGPKFTYFFRRKRGATVFWANFGYLHRLVLETFAVKVWSCQKSHRVLPQLIFERGPPNFATYIIKHTQLPIMWQSFKVIGGESSEISWRKKRNSIKTTQPGTIRSARP